MQGIPAHVDTHSAFTDQLVSISLGSDITMEFCRPPPHGATVAVRLPRRSALIMDGEARSVCTLHPQRRADGRGANVRNGLARSLFITYYEGLGYS